MRGHLGSVGWVAGAIGGFGGLWTTYGQLQGCLVTLSILLPGMEWTAKLGEIIGHGGGLMVSVTGAHLVRRYGADWLRGLV